MLQTEPPTILNCRHGMSQLVADPEWDEGDWFIRCLVCGARNLLAISIQIVGWRRSNTNDIGVSSRLWYWNSSKRVRKGA